ncbi:MAG: ABC transporter ATP-binding protein [Erysipelotrichaceae bacterium]|nr:ABC transporter ATP-binding protein [Erysipelotrichaceae bacterium]
MTKIIKNMGRIEWTYFALSVILVICQVYFDLKVPDYMANITILVKTPGSPLSDIWLSGIKMLLCAITAMLITFLSDLVTSKLAATFSLNLRAKVFGKINQFSLEEIDNFSVSSLITRSTNDIATIQRFVAGGLNQLVKAPITVAIALTKISGKHWQWSTLTCVCVFVIICVIGYVVKYAHPRFRKMQVLTDELNKATRENLTGIRVVKAYNASKYQEDKFAKANNNLTDNAMQAHHAMAIMQPTMKFLNNGLTIGIYLTGAYIISTLGYNDALVTFSEMVVFSTYASKILQAFMSLNMVFNQMPRAGVCAERVNEVLEQPLSILDGDKEEGTEKGTIEFRDVSFTYPGASSPALNKISFSGKKGETIAFIGATGSGKTTLVNLVMRFYDTSSGEILIDGINVKDYKLKSLRSKIGYAPQRAILMTGSVESNIAYGDSRNGERDQEAIRKAIEIAQAKDFVENMPDSYQGAIARGGANVSGGQKQRLSIARAIYRQPEFYIFDDAFSALDYKTDRALRNALKEETSGVTTLIVAQRIGTIRDADKIIVLDEGGIVGMGTHNELMSSCKTYQEIAYTQLSKEELA